VWHTVPKLVKPGELCKSLRNEAGEGIVQFGVRATVYNLKEIIQVEESLTRGMMLVLQATSCSNCLMT